MHRVSRHLRAHVDDVLIASSELHPAMRLTVNLAAPDEFDTAMGSTTPRWHMGANGMSTQAAYTNDLRTLPGYGVTATSDLMTSRAQTSYMAQARSPSSSRSSTSSSPSPTSS